MTASRDQQLDLGFLDLPQLALYPQDPVTVVQVKIDPAMRKGLLQEENDMSGNPLILHIGLEDFYNFHTDNIVRLSLRSQIIAERKCLC